MTDAWDGRPQNPERDGWHWLNAGGSPVTCEWRASRGWMDETWLMRAWELPYLGPCLTPAEVEARVAEARRGALEEAAEWHDGEARILRCPTMHSLPAMPGSIISRDRAGIHEKSAAAIRALKERGDE